MGFIDDDARKQKGKIQGYKVLGGHADLPALVATYDVKEIIVASGSIRQENLQATRAVCEKMGVTLRNLELSIR